MIVNLSRERERERETKAAAIRQIWKFLHNLKKYNLMILPNRVAKVSSTSLQRPPSKTSPLPSFLSTNVLKFVWFTVVSKLYINTKYMFQRFFPVSNIISLGAYLLKKKRNLTQGFSNVPRIWLSLVIFHIKQEKAKSWRQSFKRNLDLNRLNNSWIPWRCITSVEVRLQTWS